MTPRAPRARALRLAGAALFAAALQPASAFAEPAGCGAPIGRIVSVEGTVELRREGTPDWVAVRRLDTRLCENDAVRTRERSRAALWISPENVIRLDRSTAVRLTRDAEGQRVVDFFTDPGGRPDPDCGAAYFVSRFPRKLKTRTPFLNAAVEGTEFLVLANCGSASVFVYEGRVRVEPVGGGSGLDLASGTGVRDVAGGDGELVRITIRPRDGVQWALWYPRLSPGPLAQASQDCLALPVEQRAACEAGNVESALLIGAVQEADDAIARLRAMSPAAAGEADAFEAIRRIVVDDKAGAMTFAERAAAAPSAGARAFLALSYARQANADLEGAVAAAHLAARAAPQSAAAHARHAEMLLTVGRFDAAAAAARSAVAAAPADGRALVAEGYVLLAQGKGREAEARFARAMQVDSGDPRARFGSGLAKIRQRRLAEGREDLEIAVALDPGSAVLRAYLGRAYFEENTPAREAAAASQYRLARERDPADPTPWFYDGARKQQAGRPIEAAADFGESRRLNDNRAVYRPRDALDQDAAARSVAVARSYSALGFDQPAVTEAATALAEDVGNFAAHQYLSEASAGLARQQFTRASAGLQAQLRMPLGADVPLAGLASMASLTPERPFLSADTIGPARPGLYDFDPLFSGPGLRGRLRGLAGSYNSAGYDGSASVAFERSAFAAGFLHSETDGQRPNNDQLRNAFAGLATLQLTAATRLQFELQSSDTTFGDIPIRFDPAYVLRDLRALERFSLVRAGVRHQLSSGGEFIGLLSHAETSSAADFAAAPLRTSERGSFTVPELQWLSAWRAAQFVVGASFIEGSRRELLELPAYGLVIPSSFGDRTGTVYGYSTWALLSGAVRATVGAAWQNMDLDSVDYRVERIHPKLGVVWSMPTGTTLRAAAFSATQRQLMGGQTLEPVQVAGFGQYFDDPYGSYARRAAVALDQRLGAHWLAGITAGARRIEVLSTFFDALGATRSAANPWTEREAGIYLHWTPRPSLAFSASIMREAFERTDAVPGLAQFTRLYQWRTPLTAQWFGESGFSLNARLSYLAQRGTFCAQGAGVCAVEGDERSVVADAGVAYRLPRRRGVLSLDVLNLFDRPFAYQGLDFSRWVPFSGRALFVRMSLSL